MATRKVVGFLVRPIALVANNVHEFLDELDELPVGSECFL